MSDRIRYQYESLEAFARKFSDHAAETEQVRARLNSQLTVLENGGWLGEGAKRFSAEMREQILPALDNLVRALDGANAGILRASEMMREAEEEAAALFRSFEVAAPQRASAAAGQPAGASVNHQTQIAALSGLRDEQTRFMQDLRRGMEGLGGQLAGVQAAYDRLMAEATSRADRMTALIGTLRGGAAL